jgi:hypothetical protein
MSGATTRPALEYLMPAEPDPGDRQGGGAEGWWRGYVLYELFACWPEAPIRGFADG